MKEDIYVTTKGTGDKAIVWLHGLWGGGNYYRDFLIPAHSPQEFPHKTTNGDFWRTSTQYFPDLLGFGKSPKPNIEYTPLAHVQALVKALPKDKKLSIVGVSLGALIAINFAKYYPDRVKTLILVSPPLYRDEQEAIAHLSSGKLARLTIHNPRLTSVICRAFCKTKLLSLAAPIFARKGQKRISLGVTSHAWHSYYSTFTNVLLKTHIADLEAVSQKVPTLIIFGANDNYLPVEHIDLMANQNLYKIEGAWHDLFLEKFDQTSGAISDWLIKHG